MAFPASGAAAPGGAASSPTSGEASPHADTVGARRRNGFWALSLGSIGVVFGDIGTSPLHAFKAAMEEGAEGHSQPPGLCPWAWCPWRCGP